LSITVRCTLESYTSTVSSGKTRRFRIYVQTALLPYAREARARSNIAEMKAALALV
jgi:hypothetical protein